MLALLEINDRIAGGSLSGARTNTATIAVVSSATSSSVSAWY